MCIYIVAVPARAPRTVTAERRSLSSAIQQDDCCRPVNKVAIHPGTGSQDLNNRATETMEKLGDMPCAEPSPMESFCSRTRSGLASRQLSRRSSTTPPTAVGRSALAGLNSECMTECSVHGLHTLAGTVNHVFSDLLQTLHDSRSSWWLSIFNNIGLFELDLHDKLKLS